MMFIFALKFDLIGKDDNCKKKKKSTNSRTVKRHTWILNKEGIKRMVENSVKM